MRCVQKTTSHISLNFETVSLLSKFVCPDSEICFESNSNERIKCLGFCGTRKQIFFRIVSCVVVMRPHARNSDFGCTLVLWCMPQDLKVSQEVSQIEWQSLRAHKSIELYEFDSCIFTHSIEVSGKTIVEPGDEIEKNKLTIFVRTSSGKTISIKYDKKNRRRRQYWMK